LHNDGNLLDAFSYAAIISLFRFRLPFVSVEMGKIKIHSPEEKRPQTLSIHHFPISMTFAVATLKAENSDETEYIVFDPSVELGLNS
jgi:exosome complex RNA-binding protein Rrp42 (RNase PH superfamily)